MILRNRASKIQRWGRCILLLSLLLNAVMFVLPVLANDQAIAAADYQHDELPLPSAIQFPVVFKSTIDSKHSKVGDPVIATLKEDLVIAGRLVAAANSEIFGRIQVTIPAKSLTTAPMTALRSCA